MDKKMGRVANACKSEYIEKFLFKIALLLGGFIRHEGHF